MNMRTYARPCTGLGVLVGVGVGVGVERRGRALTCTGVIHGSLSPCISLYLAASRYISLHLHGRDPRLVARERDDGGAEQHGDRRDLHEIEGRYGEIEGRCRGGAEQHGDRRDLHEI